MKGALAFHSSHSEQGTLEATCCRRSPKSISLNDKDRKLLPSVVVQHFNQNFKLEFASHFYLPLLKFKPRMGKKIPPHNESLFLSGLSVVPTGLVPACLHRFFTGKSCLAAKGDRETSSLPCGDRLAPKTGKQDYTYLRSFGLQTLTDFFFFLLSCSRPSVVLCIISFNLFAPLLPLWSSSNVSGRLKDTYEMVLGYGRSAYTPYITQNGNNDNYKQRGSKYSKFSSKHSKSFLSSVGRRRRPLLTVCESMELRRRGKSRLRFLRFPLMPICDCQGWLAELRCRRQRQEE